MDTFFGSLVQLRCGEGGTLQTNNTGMCLQCLSHTCPAPAQCMCALPTLTAQVLCCSTGNHLTSVLGCMHLPGLSRSGSGIRVVLSGTGYLVFCPSQVQAAQVMRCLLSTVAMTYHLHPCRSVFWVYNQRTFAGGCPEPQEVLVSKEACLQFRR